MKFTFMGKSGLRVSEICLGTMTFGLEFGWGNTKEASQEVFQTFVEAGGNFFDTANHYTKGTSEKLLGEFIGSRRQEFVIATKYTLSQNRQDPNAGGNHRKNMLQSLEASLKRLNTDFIDLYWIHAWDFTTSVDEVLRALDDMVRAGKILHIGISNAPAWVISQANTIAELRGRTPFIGMQLEYSLVERAIEREFFSLAQAFDLTITAWSPLGMGVLTGKYNQNPSQQSRFEINKEWGKRFINDRNLKIAQAVVQVAQEIGKTPAQVALNWIRQKNEVMIIPIIGAKVAEQLKDNLKCLDFALDKNHMEKLNAVSQIELGYPYAASQDESMRKMVLGDRSPFIEKHCTWSTL